jgi:SAM-dependent methyltransferase
MNGFESSDPKAVAVGPGSRSEEEIARINELQRKTFDSLYERFLEPQPPEVLERLRRIVAAARPQPGATILDVGSGVGALIPYIREADPGRIVACDLSGAMLEELGRHYPEVKRRRCDVRDLALPDASVDVVFMNAVFGNIADKAGAMRNVARMLKPGGRVVVSHPLGRKFVEEIARRSSSFPIEPFPYRDGFAELFASVGLDLTRYEEEEEFIVVVGEKRGGQRGRC